MRTLYEIFYVYQKQNMGKIFNFNCLYAFIIVIHHLPRRSNLPVAFLDSHSLALSNSALFGKMSIAMTSARHFMRNKGGLTEAILNQAILPNFNDPYGCRFTYELKK